MSELIPRTTVGAVVAKRNKALDLYATAREYIAQAQYHMDAAHAAAREAAPEQTNRYTHAQAPEIDRFYNSVSMPNAEEFMRVARRVTDLRVWGHLLAMTDLDHLMDKAAKDELRDQMAYVPEITDDTGALINGDEIAKGLPQITEDTILATLEGFAMNSGDIFRRGLANAFSGLDRKFRSHDGFKIGSRVILARAFDPEWGGWNSYGNLRDTLVDIERVFLILDGKGPRASYAGIIGTIDHERKEANIGWGRIARTEHEGDYFRVRIFKNGNAHLWFTRDDLVTKANKLLAEYYGEVVGDGVDAPQDPEAVFEDRALTPAKHFGFYPTPAAIADRIARDEFESHFYRHPEDAKPLRFLEPSAGTGRLVNAICGAARAVTICKRWSITAIEVQRDLAAELRTSMGLNTDRVICRDFLQMKPANLGPHFDIIYMNPPFDLQRDIDHVTHAWKFLKPGGKLVAIMSAGTEFRENKKAVTFRKWVDTNGGRFRDLPAGTFREAGTNVNTCYLAMTKKEES